MEDPAVLLTNRWLALFAPWLGYNRKTRGPTDKAKNNGMYKHNLSWIRTCLEEGYTFDEVNDILNKAKNVGGDLKFVNSILPVPKRSNIILDPSLDYHHPDLFDENSKLITTIQVEGLVLCLLRRCRIVDEDDPAISFFVKRESGTLFYLLDSFSLDEILFMSDVCHKKKDELKSLVELPKYVKDARKNMSASVDLGAALLRTLRYTKGE